MPPKAENGAAANSRANGNAEPSTKSISAAEKRRIAAAKEFNSNATANNTTQALVNNPSTNVTNTNGTGHAHDGIEGVSSFPLPSLVF